jgi:1,5-anhydro-D-fructose reductase (1,5-anhydro-D-mannitol-forming)
MRHRPSAPRPTLALAGGGPLCTLHALAAAEADVDVVALSAHPDDPAARAVATDLHVPLVAPGALGDAAGAIVVTAPLADRVAMAEAAAGGGARVLVEAPLAPTLAAADALLAVVAGHDVRYGENLLWAPAVRAALSAIARIGPITYLEARGLRPRPPEEHLPDASSAGGALLDVGVHPLALVLAAVGEEVVEVRGELDAPPGSALDDAGVAHLTLTSGATARVEASWRTAQPVWDLQAASADGVVRLELFPEPVLEVDGDPIALPAAARGTTPSPLVGLGYADQLRALVGEATGTTTLGLGRRVLEVVCAAYRSAGRGGAAEPLPFQGPRDLTPHQLWRGP